MCGSVARVDQFQQNQKVIVFLVSYIRAGKGFNIKIRGVEIKIRQEKRNGYLGRNEKRRVVCDIG